MPFTISYDNPNPGPKEPHLFTHTNVTKVEGVWFVGWRGAPSHLRLYVGSDPHTHHRLPYLVPMDTVRRFHLTGKGSDADDYREGHFTDELSPEERSIR